MYLKLKKEEFFRRFIDVVPGENNISFVYNKIETDIYFEPLSMLGLEEMHKYSIDERLYEFFEFAPFKKLEDTKNYIEKLQKRMSGNDEDVTSKYWFVRRKSDNYLIGTSALVNLDYNRSSIEWGYGVDPELWGQGYILQIQEVLKQHVFDVLDLNRLHGVTMINNKKTISSILAAGMKHEGTLRQFYCKDGQFIDGWKYAMLKVDYFKIIKNNNSNNKKFTTNEVVEIVQSVLIEEVIDENSSMLNSHSWDSLSHMMIMVQIFEKTKFQFSPLQISNATSVKIITSLLNLNK